MRNLASHRRKNQPARKTIKKPENKPRNSRSEGVKEKDQIGGGKPSSVEGGSARHLAIVGRNPAPIPEKEREGDDGDGKLFVIITNSFFYYKKKKKKSRRRRKKGTKSGQSDSDLFPHVCGSDPLQRTTLGFPAKLTQQWVPIRESNHTSSTSHAASVPTSGEDKSSPTLAVSTFRGLEGDSERPAACNRRARHDSLREPTARCIKRQVRRELSLHGGRRSVMGRLLSKIREESKQTWSLAGPAILTGTFQFSIATVTAAFVGRLGALQLSAVSVAQGVIAGFAYGAMVIKDFNLLVSYHVRSIDKGRFEERIVR
ncbi:hypothetical protein BHM03_00030967 [Ensete ventricosum]|nr:hypothetical protein BHM03_00030967 [Ensete ventricosum]